MVMMNNDYNMIKLAEVDSTNEYAKKIAKAGAKHFTVVIAEKQSAGKGRLGRRFLSHAGTGIFMSIVLRPDIEPEVASRLTLVAAVAVRRVLNNICQLETAIKWPNDLVSDGKKVCGILTEMSTEMGRVKYVILGVGINVSNESFEDELSDVATSIFMLTGKRYDKETIIEAVLKEFLLYYEKFLITGDLSCIKRGYDSCLVNKDKMVKIINGNTVLQGICRGVGNAGELLVENEKGMEKIISGEVSVRGVYGYV